MTWEQRMADRAAARQAQADQLEAEDAATYDTPYVPVHVPAGAAVAVDTGEPSLMWEVAVGSTTAHLVAVDAPAGRTGPRTQCGRYPQRNGDGTWFALPQHTSGVLRSLAFYACTPCPDCQDTEP